MAAPFEFRAVAGLSRRSRGWSRHSSWHESVYVDGLCVVTSKLCHNWLAFHAVPSMFSPRMGILKGIAPRATQVGL